MSASPEAVRRNEVLARLRLALTEALKYYGTLLTMPKFDFEFEPRRDTIGEIRHHIEETVDLADFRDASLKNLPIVQCDPLTAGVHCALQNIDWPFQIFQDALFRVAQAAREGGTEEAIRAALETLDPVINWKSSVPTLDYEGQTWHPRLAEHVREIAHEKGCFGPWIVSFKDGKIIGRAGNDPNTVVIGNVHHIIFIEETSTWLFRSDEAQHRMDRIAVLERERVTADLAAASAQFDLSIVLMSKDPTQAQRAFELLAERRNREQLVMNIEDQIVRHLNAILRRQREQT